MRQTIRSVLPGWAVLCAALPLGAFAQSKVTMKGTPPVASPHLGNVGPVGAPTETKLDEGTVSPERRTVDFVGFHQAKTYSRVFIKSTSRASLEVQPGPGVVRILVKNARIRLRNNLRWLDTSFFASAVWRVVPRRVGDDVAVEIQLRKAVSYRVRRQGEEIQVDFDLPPRV